MAVRKANDRWIVEFMFRGERVFKRLPAGRTKGDAQALESKLRGQIFDAVDLGKLPDPLLGKLIDEWLETKKGSKSATHTASHAKAVKRAVGGSTLSRISECGPLVTRRDDSADSGAFGRGSIRTLSAGTINRRLCILKAVAKYAYQKGYTKENLSPKIQLLPERKYQRRETDVGVLDKLLDAANTPRAKALIAFGAFTGMRLGEVLKLDPEDAVGGSIHVVDPKNGEDRFIPILKELEPHLAQLPFSANWRNVYRGWEAAKKRAGVKMRYHDLRHIAATIMAEAGDPITLMSVMGWKSVQTARRYIHPSQKAKAKLMGRITSKLHQARRNKTAK